VKRGSSANVIAPTTGGTSGCADEGRSAHNPPPRLSWRGRSTGLVKRGARLGSMFARHRVSQGIAVARGPRVGLGTVTSLASTTVC